MSLRFQNNRNKRLKPNRLGVLFLGVFSFYFLLSLSSCGLKPETNEETTSTPPVNVEITLESAIIQDNPVTITATNQPTTDEQEPVKSGATPTPPLPCSPEYCIYQGHFYLTRPISPANNDNIDQTYRYGSTQEGARPTHHGVEFVNEEGTPVLAAADGKVVVAGNDAHQAYADFPFYYGNVVIIQHQFPSLDKPVYTLYGHLNSVEVQPDDIVETGDQIGTVGYTGIAEWSHLHFEVRVGENIFRMTRNPELWLAPHQDDDTESNGVLAGRIIDEYEAPIYIPAVVVELLNPEDEVLQTIYVETYADYTVNGDDTWRENFAIGDLPPGRYRVSFVARGLQVREVEVYPGQVTLMVFDASQ